MEDQAALILGVKMNGFFIPTNSDTYAVYSHGNGWGDGWVGGGMDGC